MNNVLNSGACVLPLQQGQTGTCWFMTIMNLFLCNQRSKKVVENALVEYMKTLTPTARQDLLTTSNTSHPTCPAKTARLFLFWKTIYHFFYSGMTPAHINARRLVRSAIPHRREGLFRPAHNIGTFPANAPITNYVRTESEIKFILDRLKLNFNTYRMQHGHPHILNAPNPDPDFLLLIFPENYNSSPPSTIGINYRLTSVAIDFGNRPEHSPPHKSGAHAIAGVKCGGHYYLLDSNVSEKIPCDWRNPANVKNSIKPYYFNHPRVEIRPQSFAQYRFAVYFKDQALQTLRTKNQINSASATQVANVSHTQTTPGPPPVPVSVHTNAMTVNFNGRSLAPPPVPITSNRMHTVRRPPRSAESVLRVYGSRSQKQQQPSPLPPPPPYTSSFVPRPNMTAEARAGPSQLNLSNIRLRTNWRNVLRNFMNVKSINIKSVKNKYPNFFSNINKSAMEHLYRIHGAKPRYTADKLINAITELQAKKRNEPAVYNKKVATAWKALLKHINKYSAIH